MDNGRSSPLVFPEAMGGTPLQVLGEILNYFTGSLPFNERTREELFGFGR